MIKAQYRSFFASQKSQHIFTQNYHFIKCPTADEVSLPWNYLGFLAKAGPEPSCKKLRSRGTCFSAVKSTKEVLKKSWQLLFTWIFRALVCCAAANKKPAWRGWRWNVSSNQLCTSGLPQVHITVPSFICSSEWCCIPLPWSSINDLQAINQLTFNPNWKKRWPKMILSVKGEEVNNCWGWNDSWALMEGYAGQGICYRCLPEHMQRGYLSFSG